MYGTIIAFVILIILALFVAFSQKYSIKDKNDDNEAPYKIEPPSKNLDF